MRAVERRRVDPPLVSPAECLGMIWVGLLFVFRRFGCLVLPRYPTSIRALAFACINIIRLDSHYGNSNSYGGFSAASENNDHHEGHGLVDGFQIESLTLFFLCTYNVRPFVLG